MNLNEFLNSEQSEIILPLFKEMAIDFETGEIIISYEKLQKFYDTTEVWIGTQVEYSSLTYERPNTVFYIVSENDLATTKKTENFEWLDINPEITMLTGKNAILVWVWKALRTDSNVYRAYSDKFGNRLSDEIGYIYDREIKSQLINSMIEDCLLYNPYITRVYEFEHIFDEDTLNLNISFKIDTIYGTIDTKEASRLNVKTSI